MFLESLHGKSIGVMGCFSEEGGEEFFGGDGIDYVVGGPRRWICLFSGGSVWFLRILKRTIEGLGERKTL